METIEIVIYLVIALIVGILTLTLITTWDYRSAINAISGNEKEPSFEKISKEQFAIKAAIFWKSCGLGAVHKTVSFYVEPDTAPDSISRADFFTQVRIINYCGSIQSADPADSCGSTDNVDFTSTIPLPHVIKLECDEVNRKLVITQ